MDPALYKAAISGDFNALKQNKGKLEYDMTKNNNTVLHLVSQLGHANCVVEILKMHPSLLLKLNSRNETALHLAAQNGHASVCTKLINYTHNSPEIESGNGVGGAGNGLLWIQNKQKDTALHLASRYNFSHVVELLTKENPNHLHPANDAGETPLYLAASRGHPLVVAEILLNCDSPFYYGPNGTTSLHGAVISNNSECVRKLLEWDGTLIRKTDETGQTPLHYAAFLGHPKAAKELMLFDRSCAYIADGDGNNTALHLAASRGSIAVLAEILSICPDTWDLTNGLQERNILHIAMDQGHKKMVEFILEKCPVISSIIDQKDVDGNTPFHLMATSLCFLPKLLYHTLVDKRALNNNNMTPLDLVTSTNHPPQMALMKRRLVREMNDAGISSSFNSSLWKTISSHGHDLNSFEETDTLRKMGDTHMIVAALVATIAFGAGFTMPGGYYGNEGRDLGLAILAKKGAFAVFVVADTLALLFSVLAMSIHFSTVTTQPRLDLLEDVYEVACHFVKLSIQAMLMAFLAGTYVTLAPSGLAIAICVVGSAIGYIVLLLFHALPTLLTAESMSNTDRQIEKYRRLFDKS